MNDGQVQGSEASAAVRSAGMTAMVAAAAFVAALAVRPITSYDIGYHLAYGEHFLRHGRIVQTDRFIYTRLDEEILADPDQLGPGCKFDPATNTYSFVNANWLSQVVLAGVARAGGMLALSGFRAALVVAIFAVVVVIMRRGGAAWHWIAAAVVLIAVTSYERFDLRPELLGYLMLVGQCALLVGGGFGRRRALGVVGLQVLAVNLHSYFVLGIAMTAAMFADALLRWLWARTVTLADTSELRPRVKWLGVAAVGVIVAALVNPWFARGAIFPIQTLLYLAKHQIIGRMPGPASHVWAFVGEFRPTLDESLRAYRSSTAYVVVLAVVSAGMLAALIARRWGWVLIMAGMIAVSYQMRRNIPLGALLPVPLATVALAGEGQRLRARLAAGRLKRFLNPAACTVALAVTALAGWWTISVVASRFYFSDQRRPWRFGLGASKVMLPIEAAEWIKRHRPAGNVWCNFSNSSNLLHLLGGEYRVPVLTNTWACPPYVIRQVENTFVSPSPRLTRFKSIVAENNVGTVVARFTRRIPPLIRLLADSDEWAPVHISSRCVVFVRRAGPTAALAREHGLTERELNREEFLDRIAGSDPIAGSALHDAARLLVELGWTDSARAAWQRAVALEPALKSR